MRLHRGEGRNHSLTARSALGFEAAGAAWLATTAAAAARIAENSLLSAINAASTQATSAAVMGAARDILSTVDQAAAGLRYTQRIDRNTTLRVILDDWARDMLRADVARPLANGSNAGDPDGDTLAVADA